MRSTLPSNWVIKRLEDSKYSQYSRFFYYDPVKNITQWIRPSPMPGYEGQWPLYMRCAHILIKHTKSRNPKTHNKGKQFKDVTLTREQALNQIKSLRNDILKGDRIFEKIAKKYSDCSSYQVNGDLDWKMDGELEPDFVKCARNLKIGEISEPVETRSGWHIIKRIDGYQPPIFNPNSPPPPPPPPPSPDLDFFVPRKVQNRVKEIAPKLYQLQYLIETKPDEMINWTNFLDLYQSAMPVFTKCHEIFIRSMLYFFPGEFDALKYAYDLLKKYQKYDLCDEILNMALTYTWNPKFWNLSFSDSEKNPIRVAEQRKAMMENVGCTVNITIYWLQFINSIQEAKYDSQTVLNELKKALDIGLENSNILINKLKELSPQLVDYYQNRQEKLKPMIERRKLMLLDHEKYKKPLRFANNKYENQQNGNTNNSINAQEEERFQKWRKFLNDELKNDAEYPEDLFLQVMDYNYRFALGALWWMPSIWMEYWSFLIRHNNKTKGEKILEIAKKAVGDTPLFELKRAQYFIELNKYDEARDVYTRLIENHGDPLMTAALTLLFKATVELQDESAAMEVIRNFSNYAKPQFFINAAKLCNSTEIAWAIFQMGVDRFPLNNQLIIEAAEFLEQHRDVRNTRLLFQQSFAEKNDETTFYHVHFEIKKRLFQFELNHIAPLDHLNETQKVFDPTDVDPSILYMHRFKFADLYPLDPDELKVWGHLSSNLSIDLIDTQDDTVEYLTTTFPYKSKKEELKIDTEWVNNIRDNKRKTAGTETATGQGATQQKRIPREVHHLLRDISEFKLHIAPITDVDKVIERIKNTEIRDYRMMSQYQPQMQQMPQPIAPMQQMAPPQMQPMQQIPPNYYPNWQ
ncbi:positive regulation of chromatin silencing at rDNA [Tritrichomonas musculus]|uniref:peptidylprolyl isomerase n=1 Tax=Tritrichomonas musculus TaxID=1915356 RepID=A0ABR2JZE1_9EUKA